MPQEFLSFEKQIKKLESDKNLLIPDHSYAETKLKQIGYFSLVSGYKKPFINSTTKKYKDGTTFNDIVSLYEFDENMRELFLKYILKIERHIRSLVSYHFTDKFGESQTFYLDDKNFVNSQNVKVRQDIRRLTAKLTELAVDSNNYHYINYHRNKYGNVPLWVLVNAVTLGTLSKFYTLMTPDLKVKVSKNFDGVNERQVGQYLRVITKFRNVCAHNDRLFSYQTKDEIPDTPLHKKLEIKKYHSQYVCGKHDLFSVVITFRYFLSDEDFKKFKQSIKKIIKQFSDSSDAITKEDLLKMMGFPLNWEKISTYKK